MPSWVIGAAVTFALVAPAARSAELPSAAELARKIAHTLGAPSVVSIETRNLSALSAEQVTEARRAIEKELRRRRVRIEGPTGAPVAITVTFSENSGGAVWVAEIKRGEALDVVIESGLLPILPPASPEPLIALERTRLWEQESAILDVAVLENDMFILSPGAIRHAWKDGGRWNDPVLVPLGSARRWPRDPRGRVHVAGDVIRVHLPGFFCEGTLERPVKMECTERPERWPFPPDSEMAEGRNFFVAKGLPPFYSAARLEDEGAELLAIAGVDGRAYLYSGAGGQAEAIDGWGADIAAIRTSCGGWLILATRAEVIDGRDAILAYEITNRQPVAVSRPLEFNGVVTALWPDSSGNKAVAVARDSKTERHAAYSVSVTCGR